MILRSAIALHVAQMHRVVCLVSYRRRDLIGTSAHSLQAYKMVKGSFYFFSVSVEQVCCTLLVLLVSVC